MLKLKALLFRLWNLPSQDTVESPSEASNVNTDSWGDWDAEIFDSYRVKIQDYLTWVEACHDHGYIIREHLDVGYYIATDCLGNPMGAMSTSPGKCRKGWIVALFY